MAQLLFVFLINQTIIDVIDMTSEEILEAFSQATEEAVKKTHAAGLPTTHADDVGIYELYPDGRKVYKYPPD